MYYTAIYLQVMVRIGIQVQIIMQQQFSARFRNNI